MYPEKGRTIESSYRIQYSWGIRTLLRNWKLDSNIENIRGYDGALHLCVSARKTSLDYY